MTNQRWEQSIEEKLNKPISNSERTYATLKADGIELTNEEIRKALYEDGETLLLIANKYFDQHKEEEALPWYGRALKQRYSPAQSKVGHMFLYGQGVTKDYKSAMQFSRLSADNDGNKEAQYNIGWMYRNALGVPKNIPNAIEWYTKAANQGHKEAQFNIGWIYENESEVKDLQKAVDWYQVAVDNDFKSAQSYLKKLNEQGYFAKQKSKASEKIKVEPSQITYFEDSNDSAEDIKSTLVYNSKSSKQKSSTLDDEDDKFKRLEEEMKRLLEKEAQANRRLHRKHEMERRLLKKEIEELKEYKIENDFFRQQITTLELEKSKTESQQRKKDEEIKRLKRNYARNEALIDDFLKHHNSYNDYTDNGHESDTNYDTAIDQSDNDSCENDPNLDSSEDEDVNPTLHYIEKPYSNSSTRALQYKN